MKATRCCCSLSIDVNEVVHNEKEERGSWLFILKIFIVRATLLAGLALVGLVRKKLPERLQTFEAQNFRTDLGRFP